MNINMIDKRTLNNEIVAMRKVVKQAKVHIIGKLSREIKNLRNKEGPEELKAKCNRKADRKRDEIYAVKKLAVDDVSKFALKNLEDPVKKIGDAGVNSELRAYFRFAASKVLSARVTAFREQYPDWKDYIHDLLDELGARRKNLKPQVRLTKEMGPAQNTPLTKKNREIEHDEKPSVLIQRSKEAIVESAADKINGKFVTSKASPALVKKSKFLSQWSVEEIEPTVDQVSHVEIHQKDRLKNVKGAKSSQSASAVPSAHKLDNQLRWSSTKKSSGIAEVKRFQDLCVTQESPSIGTTKSPVMDEGNSEDDDVTADGQVVDPFFVKSDGKTEYVTKMVVDEGVDEGEKDSPLPFAGREKQSRGAQQWSEGGWGAREGSRGGRGRGRGFRGGRGSFSDRGQASRGRDGHRWEKPWSEQGGRGHDRGSRFGGRGESGRGGNSAFSQKNQAKSAEGATHLHPSWEAKRRQKEQSISNVAFQGKKIKFDDDD